MSREIQFKSLGGIPIQLDTLARDFPAIRDELIRLASSLTPEWTDFYPGDPGVVILESVAYVADLLSYLLDRVQNESYLITAQERSSVVDLLRLIGYELSPGSAASVPLQIVLEPGVTQKLIPAGYTVQSKATDTTPALRFEVLEDTLVVYPGGEVIAVHGETVTEEEIGVSDGSASMSFDMDRFPIAISPNSTEPVEIFVSGQKWSLVESFIDTEFDSQVFRLQIDEDGRGTVIFGDGVNGAIPLSGEVVTATYRVGGGEVGNSAGKDTLKYPVSDIGGIQSVTNPVQPSGGKNRESIAEAKVLGPQSVRTLDRAVTLEDYEYLAQAAPGAGIAFAKAEIGDTPLSVDVYVATAGDNPTPSGTWYPDIQNGTGSVGAVGRWLASKKLAGVLLRVKKPTLVRPFVGAKVHLYSNFQTSDVRNQVRKNLIQFFRDAASSFGNKIAYSDVIYCFEDTRGVKSVDLWSLHRKPEMRLKQGSESGFFDTTMSVTNLHRMMISQTFEVRWLNGSRFKLFFNKFGPITDSDGAQIIFDEGSTYEIVIYQSGKYNAPESPQFSLRIDTGVIKPRYGDTYVIDVDSYSDNMNCGPNEIIVPTVYGDGTLDPTEFNLTFGGGIGK